MNRRRILSACAGALLTLAASACGPAIDLSKALTVTDVFSGYYDSDIVDGKAHMVPDVTFRLKNVSAEAFSGVQVEVSFWKVGDDGENDSVMLRGIGADALAPGAQTDPIRAQAPHGFTVEGARADMFSNHDYRDFVVKIFGRRGGKIYKLGEFPIDRVIIPHARTVGGL